MSLLKHKTNDGFKEDNKVATQHSFIGKLYQNWIFLVDRIVVKISDEKPHTISTVWLNSDSTSSVTAYAEAVTELVKSEFSMFSQTDYFNNILDLEQQQNKLELLCPLDFDKSCWPLFHPLYKVSK